jgi:hypothetical protein
MFKNAIFWVYSEQQASPPGIALATFKTLAFCRKHPLDTAKCRKMPQK